MNDFTALTTNQMNTIFVKLVNLRWDLLRNAFSFYIDNASSFDFWNLEKLKEFENLVSDFHEIESIIEGIESK